MKKLALLGGAGALSVMALFHAPIVQAADHLDGPALATNPMADINDVYAWMTPDASKVNLAMTVSPADDGTRTFGPTVQYVFHVLSHPDFQVSGVESKVICTFTSNTAGACWLLKPDGTVFDYVEGDLSIGTGQLSASGKFRVFAGRRSDPFFFNLGGFRTASTSIKNTTITTDIAGCPNITGALAGTLRTQLQTAPSAAVAPCPANQADCFLNLNVMAIVVQVEKAQLLNSSNKLLSVWGSTHMTP